MTYHTMWDRIAKDMMDDENWEQISLLQEKWVIALEAKKEAESSRTVLENKLKQCKILVQFIPTTSKVEISLHERSFPVHQCDMVF